MKDSIQEKPSRNVVNSGETQQMKRKKNLRRDLKRKMKNLKNK